jgi:hypothetical protein
MYRTVNIKNIFCCTLGVKLLQHHEYSLDFPNLGSCAMSNDRVTNNLLEHTSPSRSNSPTTVLFHPRDEGDMLLSKIGKCLPAVMTKHHRILAQSATLRVPPNLGNLLKLVYPGTF